MTTPTSGGSGDGVRSGPGSMQEEPAPVLLGLRFQEFDLDHNIGVCPPVWPPPGGEGLGVGGGLGTTGYAT